MSGFCLLLSGNTLNFWLAQAGVDLVTLGLFTLVALPYSLKYFIAVAMDKINLPIRFWLFMAQAVIVLCLIGFSQLSAEQDYPIIAVLAGILSLAAVGQDIYLDKLRIDKTYSSNKGYAAGGYIAGYRLGMLVSGAGLIFLSSLWQWPDIFYVTSGTFILLSLSVHLFINDITSLTTLARRPFNFKQDIIEPIINIAHGKHLLYILALIILYRLADNLLAVLANPFLLHLGFNAAEIATASKFFGTTMAILGGIIGGTILQKYSIRQALYWFGLIHLLTHVLFVVQAKVGYNLGLLYVVNGAESLTGSMAMVAYIAYITSLCDKQYGTTQYALLSSIMGLSRTLLPASAGALATQLSWETCFIVITLVGIPGVMLSSKLCMKNLS